MRLIFASRLSNRARDNPRLRAWLFRCEAFVLGAGWRILRLLPPEGAVRLGAWLIGIIGPRSAKAAVVKSNYKIAFPEWDAMAVAAASRSMWRSLGAIFAEYAHLPQIASSRRRIRVIDHCGLERYRHGARRAIFVGAHLSNWEVMAIALAREGVPLLVVEAPLQNPQFEELMKRARHSLGYRTLPRGAPMRDLIAHLRGGGSIGMLLDVAIEASAPFEFFGQPMRVTQAPARLARRYDCDIVPVRVRRLGAATFEFTAFEPLFLHPDMSDAEFAQMTTARLLAMTEIWLKESPGEWMCAKRCWEKRVYRDMGLAYR